MSDIEWLGVVKSEAVQRFDFLHHTEFDALPKLEEGVDFDFDDRLADCDNVAPVVLAGGDTMTGFVHRGEVYSASSVAATVDYDRGIDVGDMRMANASMQRTGWSR